MEINGTRQEHTEGQGSTIHAMRNIYTNPLSLNESVSL